MSETDVEIVLGARNGARFLPVQIDSILAQQHRRWTLRVGDDASTDGTAAVVAAAAQAHPDRRILLQPGPGRGSAANFLALLQSSAPCLPVAFCDQDDVWHADKLSRALDLLARLPARRPAVYAARTIVTDADLSPLRLSPLPRRAPGFGNALVQNVLGGNTIVMNAAAADLVRATVPAALKGAGVPFHDWWVYLVVTGAGGSVILDRQAVLRYRQHGDNLLGGRRGLRASATRLAMLRAGHYGDWVSRNLAALQDLRPLLTAGARETLDLCAGLAARPALARPAALWRAGVRRQSLTGDLILWALVWAGRVHLSASGARRAEMASADTSNPPSSTATGPPSPARTSTTRP